MAPQFPSDWDHASITTPDVSIAWRTAASGASCKITLTQAAPLEVQLPVSTSKVAGVTVDGQPVKWEVVPGFGRSVVKVRLPSTGSALLEVKSDDVLKTYPSVHVAGNTGDAITLQAEGGQVVDFHDPEGTLQDAKVQNGAITGTLTHNAGDHLVFGLATVGTTQQWRMFKIHTTDVQADQALTAKTEVTGAGHGALGIRFFGRRAQRRHPHDLPAGIPFAASEHLFAAAFYGWLLDVADVRERTAQRARNHPG